MIDGFGGVLERLEAQDRNLVTLLNPSTPLAHSWWSIDGGITILKPKGGEAAHVPMPDRVTTNICFGGDDLRTAYITLSSTGQLVSMPWPTAGLPLNFLNK